MIEANILREIVDTKRRQLPAQLRHGRELPLGPSRRSLARALSGSGSSFIFECKRASPSRGLMRPDERPDDMMAIYEPFADAISVLTESDYFNGSLQDLERVRSLTDKPLLAKDFFVSPAQVEQARRYGADAVLLMLSVLDDDSWRRCAATAEQFNMAVLTEVHTPGELQRAVDLGASIIGINNRDLATLSTDLATTERLAAAAPRDCLLVSESGIAERQDILRLGSLVDGFLIGTAVMSAAEPARKVRELALGEIKVCGLTQRRDLALAWQAGASFGGLIFAPGSPRRLSAAQAATLAEAAPMPLVGVFQDQSAETILAVTGQVALHAVQLHGDESFVQVANLKRQLPAGVEIWKALSADDGDILEWSRKVDRLLLDYRDDTGFGGRGHAFDWSRLPGLIDGITCPVMIAGGVDATNISRLIDPCIGGIDLCSGVEAAPGVKDPDRIRELFGAVRHTEGRANPVQQRGNLL